MTALADAYLEAASAAADLLAAPAVGDAWHKPSALSEFRVSGLAGHLATQVLNVPHVLAAEPPVDLETVSLEEHYGRVLWRGADVNADINVGIREGGEEQARAGQAALVAEVRAAIDVLPAALAAESGERPVYLPWSDRVLTVDDFLTTRLMEIAVHSDDLAYCVGVETPELSVRVMHPVYDLLFTLALRRHGWRSSDHPWNIAVPSCVIYPEGYTVRTAGGLT